MPARYEALVKEGYSKESAAKIYESTRKAGEEHIQTAAARERRKKKRRRASRSMKTSIGKPHGY